MNNGWYGNGFNHRLASMGIKSKIDNLNNLKLDMRKRFFIGSDKIPNKVLSLNPLEYIQYLQAKEDVELGKITTKEEQKMQTRIGKWVKKGNKTLNYQFNDEDKTDASFELYRTFIKLGMFKEARNKREYLENKGFKFQESINKTAERMAYQ